VTVHEEPDKLEFVVESEAGWIGLLAGPIVVAGTVCFAWRDHIWWLVAVCALGLAWMAFHLLKNRPGRSISKLTVTARELLVVLGPAQFPHRVIRFESDTVKSLEYLVGDEGEPSGLYLNKTCVLSGMGRKEAEAIAFRIFYQFPNIGCKDETPTSLLHGDGSGITSLGISGSRNA